MFCNKCCRKFYFHIFSFYSIIDRIHSSSDFDWKYQRHNYAYHCRSKIRITNKKLTTKAFFLLILDEKSTDKWQACFRWMSTKEKKSMIKSRKYQRESTQLMWTILTKSMIQCWKYYAARKRKIKIYRI